MQKPAFSELGLSPEILKAVAALGFEEASPIQAAAIPVLLEGRDVVGQSQTGSGKTAAFAIPAIELVDVADRSVQALILCPTRELATQVADEVHKLSAFKKGVHAVPIYGGASYERQFFELKKGVQIVIGTPGRIIDHLDRGTLKLDRLKMAILDEADRMLDMGFRDDIQRILDAAPAERQTVFFSATLSPPIRELIKRHSKDPATVRIEQKAVTVPTVEQFFYEVRPRLKVEALIRLIDFHRFKLGIIFCNTQMAVEDLADALIAQGIAADRLHGGISQAQRTRVMNKFKKAEFEFLVATDVAGRGIDVDDLEVVFNYDMPYDPEDYVHRIGRTGRAGRKGMAATFVFGREIFKLQHLEKFTRTRIKLAKVPTAEEVEEKRTDALGEDVRRVLEQGKFRAQEGFVMRLMEQGFNSTEIASALVHMLLGRKDEAEAPAAAPAENFASRGEEKAERRRPEPNAAERRRPEPVAEERGARGRPELGGTEAKPPGLRKASRGKVWVRVNMGREDGITPRDVVELLAGQAELPPKVVGIIELGDSEVFAQVDESSVAQVARSVRETLLGDRKLTLQILAEKGERKSAPADSGPFKAKKGKKKKK